MKRLTSRVVRASASARSRWAIRLKVKAVLPAATALPTSTQGQRRRSLPVDCADDDNRHVGLDVRVKLADDVDGCENVTKIMVPVLACQTYYVFNALRLIW